MGRNGNSWKAPSQFDDPNATVTNLVVELKKMGAPADFPPTKLKQGYGEAVCSVLQHLLDKCAFEFQKPVYYPDTYAEEAAVDDDAEMNPDVVDDIADHSGGEEEYYHGGQPVDENKNNLAYTVMESNVSQDAWQIELERVTPHLKMRVTSDMKEWRNRLAQTKQHNLVINKLSPESSVSLERIAEDLETTLEAVKKQEAKLNMQCQQEISEYTEKQEEFQTKQEEYNKNSEYINRLTNDLAQLTEELHMVKSRMDERGNSMTDTSPLIKIKGALNKIKAETRQMDIRIGVVSHTLVQKKLKRDANASKEINQSNNSLENDDSTHFN